MSTENNRVEEAKACTMKYFNDASVVYIFLLEDINGIKDNKLISNPIHAPNHELDDTEINMPPTKVSNRRIFAEFCDIREERSSSIYGV